MNTSLKMIKKEVKLKQGVQVVYLYNIHFGSINIDVIAKLSECTPEIINIYMLSSFNQWWKKINFVVLSILKWKHVFNWCSLKITRDSLIVYTCINAFFQTWFKTKVLFFSIGIFLISKPPATISVYKNRKCLTNGTLSLVSRG